MSIFVSAEIDPALTANTFIRNPTLQNALARIGAQCVLPVRSPAGDIIGAEFPCEFDSLDPLPDDDPPTEQELNEMYLLTSGWTAISHTKTWRDPISGGAYSFAEAMQSQDAWDAHDHDDDHARFARLVLEG